MGILVQSVDMFGPRVGFMKFKADVKVDGKAPPGIVFMRGGAVPVLVVLKCSSTAYTVMVRQPRVAVGKASMPEIPVGMLDGEGNFLGVAAKELKEETGNNITETGLIDMTHLAFGYEYPGMYPSCGGSDEFNRLFLYRKEVSLEHVSVHKMNGTLIDRFALADCPEVLSLKWMVASRCGVDPIQISFAALACHTQGMSTWDQDMLPTASLLPSDGSADAIDVIQVIFNSDAEARERALEEITLNTIENMSDSE